MVRNIPVAFAYDFWANNSDNTVELNCLMPNGVFIPLSANKTSSFHEIKEVRTPLIVFTRMSSSQFLSAIILFHR